MCYIINYYNYKHRQQFISKRSITLLPDMSPYTIQTIHKTTQCHIWKDSKYTVTAMKTSKSHCMRFLHRLLVSCSDKRGCTEHHQTCVGGRKYCCICDYGFSLLHQYTDWHILTTCNSSWIVIPSTYGCTHYILLCLQLINHHTTPSSLTEDTSTY